MSSLPPPVAVAPPEHRVAAAWRGPATVGALAVVGTAVLAVGDPNTTHVPLCPMQALTGLDCPFCGSLRAVHALTRFDVGAALDHNALFTLSAPFLVVAWVLWLARSLDHPLGTRWHLPAVPSPVLVGIGLVFAIARNLPAFAWLGSGA